jgi:glutamate N-acetyltransferase/amino-acid N-acetyltransferase
MSAPIINGLRLASVAAGIRHAQRPDLALFELIAGTTCAATFTQNRFCAAPVQIARHHLAQSPPRYLLINAGNANAGTGATGLQAARTCCEALAARMGVASTSVLPFSTGVIGEDLPVARILDALPLLSERLSPSAWEQVATAIMTTDTHPKCYWRTVTLGSQTATLIGIAKGAGMIHPNMATMLAFLATDALIEQAVLQDCLTTAVAQSFNSISIDGDTSTNDACVVMATGTLANPLITRYDQAMVQPFQQALTALCVDLATAIVRDGEGATKLVTIDVVGALSTTEARIVAESIAHSPLVKTAVAAGDPNWGRILAAIGRAPIDNLCIETVHFWLNEICVVNAGVRAAQYHDDQGRQVMAQSEFVLRVDLGRGTATSRLLTCDLTCDYVRINADYRT